MEFIKSENSNPEEPSLGISKYIKLVKYNSKKIIMGLFTIFDIKTPLQKGHDIAKYCRINRNHQKQLKYFRYKYRRWFQYR